MSTNPPFKGSKKRSVPDSVAKDVASEIDEATQRLIDGIKNGVITPTNLGAEIDRESETIGRDPFAETETSPDELFQPRSQTLMAQIERSYGGTIYRFGIAETVTVTSAAARRVAYEELAAQVTQQHTDFVNTTLPKQPKFLNDASAQNSNVNGGSREGLILYAADRVIKERNKQGNKIMYKIITVSGRFSQYGIVVWPEFLKEYDIWESVNGMPEDEYYKFNGVTLHVDESGKYPTAKYLTETTPNDKLADEKRDRPF